MSSVARIVMTRGATLHGVTSPAWMPRVVAAALGSQARARLIDALKGHASLEDAADFDALSRRLRASTSDIDLVVLSDRDVSGSPGTAAAAEIARSRPRTAIVAYCEPRPNDMPDMRALIVAGVHDIVLFGVNDSSVVLRAIIERARRQCSAEWVFERLRSVVPTALHLFVETALTQPESTATVTELAEVLGVHRKTLFNWCEHAVPLAPAEFLSWCRLCLVAHYLQFTPCTVETIALDMGYASVNALRNLIKRYTRRTAIQIREGGGFDAVFTELSRRLSASEHPNLHIV